MKKTKIIKIIIRVCDKCGEELKEVHLVGEEEYCYHCWKEYNDKL